MPLTIATATIKENVDFYFDTFALDRWFDPDKVVFDDGSFPGKPEPDIFLHAARKLGVPPEECLVIEDAYSGLRAANSANIGMIIAIDPFFKNRETFQKENLCKDGVITDFPGFTQRLFAEQA